MVEQVEKVTRVVDEGDTQMAAPRRMTEVHEVSEGTVAGSTLASRVIWYIAGILLVLLAFRFILALLGANPSNGFANFIYSTSHPFVAPFFGLFGYDLRYGVSRFETYTLVAMAVYAIIAYGLAQLTTINRVHHTQT